jgi:DNA-3-methyladenine glycosylase
VLLRALEPVHGLKSMQRRRRTARRANELTNGPGKLCRALGITRELNGVDLLGEELWIAPGPGESTPAVGRSRSQRIARTPRINIDYAGPDAARPLRFYLRGNACVSRRT